MSAAHHSIRRAEYLDAAERVEPVIPKPVLVPKPKRLSLKQMIRERLDRLDRERAPYSGGEVPDEIKASIQRDAFFTPQTELAFRHRLTVHMVRKILKEVR